MTEDTSRGNVVSSRKITGAERVNKSKILKAIRDRAKTSGTTIVEDSLVAIKGDEFTVYRWDWNAKEFLKIYEGTLDT